MAKIYTLYKGDKFVSVGTKKEIANELNIKIETVTYYGTPAYKKRAKKNKTDKNNRYELVELKFEKEEEK